MFGTAIFIFFPIFKKAQDGGSAIVIVDYLQTVQCYHPSVWRYSLSITPAQKKKKKKIDSKISKSIKNNFTNIKFTQNSLKTSTSNKQKTSKSFWSTPLHRILFTLVKQSIYHHNTTTAIRKVDKFVWKRNKKNFTIYHKLIDILFPKLVNFHCLNTVPVDCSCNTVDSSVATTVSDHRLLVPSREVQISPLSRRVSIH